MTNGNTASTICILDVETIQEQIKHPTCDKGNDQPDLHFRLHLPTTAAANASSGELVYSESFTLFAAIPDAMAKRVMEGMSRIKCLF